MLRAPHLKAGLPKLFANSSPPFSFGQHLPVPMMANVPEGPQETGKTELGWAPSVKGWLVLLQIPETLGCSQFYFQFLSSWVLFSLFGRVFLLLIQSQCSVNCCANPN